MKVTQYISSFYGCAILIKDIEIFPRIPHVRVCLRQVLNILKCTTIHECCNKSFLSFNKYKFEFCVVSIIEIGINTLKRKSKRNYFHKALDESNSINAAVYYMQASYFKATYCYRTKL